MKDEILALLEERPQRTIDLAVWLQTVPSALRPVLEELHDGGAVERRGWWWRLPGADAPPQQAERVLAAVTAGAQTSHAVAAATRLSVKTASAVLSRLCADGVLTPIDERYVGTHGRATLVYQLAEPSPDTKGERDTGSYDATKSGDAMDLTAPVRGQQGPVRPADARQPPRRRMISNGEELESVWSGRDPLPGFTDRPGMGSSCATAASFKVVL